MREKGAIWANIGRILSYFSREGGDFWRDFGAGKAAGGEIWGAGSGGIGRYAPGRAEARPQNQDGKTLHKMTDVGSRPNAVYLSPLGNKK